ncbi:hypothetical protein FS837_001241 [Tulasnella sp. UAMH 9824]|nr:hypothetical protein FS837_001241 [Tulasnella sp. UAMH 9824]
MHGTFLYNNHTLAEELSALRFLDLQSIVILGHCKTENPILSWLCQITPNLEMLKIAIERDRLPSLTELMASDQILKNFKKLDLDIKVRSQDLDPNSPDLAALIRVVRSGDGITRSVSAPALGIGSMRVERTDKRQGEGGACLAIDLGAAEDLVVPA